MYDLCLFPAAAAALPREHRSFKAVLFGISTGCFQAAVAVHQDGTGCRGEMHKIKGQNEKLIPKDVAAVGFAMQASRRNAGIDPGVVRRGRHQRMIDVQAQHLLSETVAFEFDVHVTP